MTVANVLVTPDEVAAFLGSGVSASDPNLIRLTNAIIADAIRRTGRRFLFAERVEYAQGYGMDYLFVRESPIASLTEVRIDASGGFDDTTIIPLTEFFWNTSNDRDTRIWRKGKWFPEGPRVAMITYKAGWYPAADTDPTHVPLLPEDIRMAIIDEIAARSIRGATDLMKSERIGEYSYTRFDGTVSPATGAIFSSYARRG
jgi:hypothetical protein